jgi:hypothetical protein
MDVVKILVLDRVRNREELTSARVCGRPPKGIPRRIRTALEFGNSGLCGATTNCVARIQIDLLLPSFGIRSPVVVLYQSIYVRFVTCMRVLDFFNVLCDALTREESYLASGLWS